MIARPARVRIRKRKPCVLARRRLFGWKVRLLTVKLHQFARVRYDVGVRAAQAAQYGVHSLGPIYGTDPRTPRSNRRDERSREESAGRGAGRARRRLGSGIAPELASGARPRSDSGG